MSPTASSAPTPAKRSKTPFVLLVLLAALLAGAAFVWRQKVSQAQCDALLDHYADLVTREHFADAGAQELAAEKQKERSEARREDDFKNCASEVQSAEHDCAMKATTSDGVKKCLE